MSNNNNQLIDNAFNKVYDKLASTGNSATEKIVDVVATVAKPIVPSTSFFTSTYTIFGFELSVYMIIILIVVLCSILYMLYGYMGFSGTPSVNVKKVNIPIDAEPTKIVQEENETEEEEGDVEEEVEDAKVCDVKNPESCKAK